MNLNSVLVGSENPDRLVAYYTKLFGEPGWAMDPYHGWQFGQGFLTIGPHDAVKGRNPAPGRLIWNLECEDVRADFERLKAAGGTVVQEPYQMGEEGSPGWICTFEDPDGNYFQLLSPMQM